MAIKHNEFWPRYLFHACHVTNAVSIVRAGRLECRENLLAYVDVANQGALNNFAGSHNHARLYLRPKNMFHLRTEGILCEGDPNRLQNHMSIPVMFLFKFVEVITNADAVFSEGNIQRTKTWLDGDAAFNALDFHAIYHDAAPPQDKGDYIRNMRMTEVGVRGGLSLQGNLSAILFRTKWDMETFKLLLEEEGLQCPYNLGIEQIHASVFQSRGLYLTNVSANDGKLNLSFSFPIANAPLNGMYAVKVVQTTALSTWTYDHSVKLPRAGLEISGFSPQDSTWKIELEGQLAFQGRLRSEVSSIFS